MSDGPATSPAPAFKTYQELIKWLTVTENAKKGIIKNPASNMFYFRKWFDKFVLPTLLQELRGGRVPGGKGVQQKYVSKVAAMVWKHLPQDRLDFWTQVEKDIKAYHEQLYPSHYTEEAKAKRAEETRLKREKKKLTSTDRGGPGPQRSQRTAQRLSPYSTQLVPSFPAPPSLPPPSTVPFSAPLPPSSSFVPPPQHYTPPFSAPALPFPLTPSTPTTAFPSAFPPQTQYQAPPFGHASVPFMPNPQALSDAVDFPFELFEEPQGGSSHSDPLSAADPFACPTTWWSIDPLIPFPRLPDHP